jgi:hypothetical protein
VVSAIPGINHPVELCDHRGCTRVSRVEGVESGALILAKPLDAEVFDPSADMRLTWVDPRGLASLDVRLLAEYEEPPITVWEVEVFGEARFVQRREHVRAAVYKPMAVQLIGGLTNNEQTGAELIDIGEASLRCWVHDPNLAQHFVEGARLNTWFELAEAEFHRVGWIGIRRPETPTEPSTIVVMFEQSAEQADELRKQVFAHQLLRRRSRALADTED